MTVPESQRHTRSVKLRLAPDVLDRLRAIAESKGETLSACVTRLVMKSRKAAKSR